uniref:Coiled-coil domain-containing protein 51-like n=1 Tax=Phallusia mammillata TaxID=59560 RepID=A0A6F9D812_9ASCI|nr:coiled-coil domain-containing protein 51-like [Phallusia mammillata]
MWSRHLLCNKCHGLITCTQKSQILSNHQLLSVSTPTIATKFYWNSASERAKQFKEVFRHRYENFYKNYEEYVGLTDVQNAQHEVKNAEKKFLDARMEERLIMRDMVTIRDELKHVRERLSHVNYSNPLYPQLASEQHELVMKEETVKANLDVAEEKERDTFLELSAAMRDSYEKERARVERTKNWSLIGSVIGTILGFIGSSYINRVRTSELKQMVKEKQDNTELKDLIDKVMPFIQERYVDVKDEITQLEATLANKLIDLPSENEAANLSTDKASYMLNHIHKELQQIRASVNKIDCGVANSKQYLQADIMNEISKINAKLKALSSKDISNVENASPTQHAEDDENEELVTVTPKPVNDIIIWGAVMSALYYVLTV